MLGHTKISVSDIFVLFGPANLGRFDGRRGDYRGDRNPVSRGLRVVQTPENTGDNLISNAKYRT